MKHLLALLLFAMAATGATVWTFSTNGTNGIVVESSYPEPTNHFDWMLPLVENEWKPGDPLAYQYDPEWQRIPFGHNPVSWLRFRRGKYGWNWNGWMPAAATEMNAVILQSSFEPVVVKTNGVWLITFKQP